MTTPSTADCDSVLLRARAAVENLIRRSGFPVSEAEMAAVELNDFGLGDFDAEGFAFVDLLRSPRLRVTLLVLLPIQTLPEHLHPAYDAEPGKEETIRVLWGEARVYVPGDANNPRLLIPQGKEAHYTSRREIVLYPGEHHWIAPGVRHWFQGGPAGAVALTLQNRVDEARNVFTDPMSKGCPVAGSG